MGHSHGGSRAHTLLVMSRAPSSSPVVSRVVSGDVSIAVREHSPAGPGKPTVVLVHGYPDQQDTWDTLIGLLPLDEWHGVTYDVRVAGCARAGATGGCVGRVAARGGAGPPGRHGRGVLPAVGRGGGRARRPAA